MRSMERFISKNSALFYNPFLVDSSGNVRRHPNFNLNHCTLPIIMHNAEALSNLISVDKKLPKKRKKTTETEPPSAKVSINADPGSNKVTVLLAVLILTLSKFNHDLPYYCYMKIWCLVVNKSNIRFMFVLQHL